MSSGPAPWHNAFNRLQRCYERNEDVIDAFFGDEAESNQCAWNVARLAGPEIETPAVWLIVLRQLVRSHAVSEGTEGACSDACVWSVGVVVQVAGVVQPCWGGPDPASVG